MSTPAEEAQTLAFAILDLINDRPVTVQTLAIAGATANLALNADAPDRALDIIVEITRAMVIKHIKIQ